MLRAGKLVVSLGGIGFIKPASATWGSLVATIFLFIIFPHLSIIIKLLSLVVVFLIGTLLSEVILKKTGEHDPYYIVIDELCGMMLVTLFLPNVWWQFLLAFVLFRVFDIAKFWPASFFDREAGGLATMIDDVIMAIPALGVLHLIIFLL